MPKREPIPNINEISNKRINWKIVCLFSFVLAIATLFGLYIHIQSKYSQVFLPNTFAVQQDISNKTSREACNMLNEYIQDKEVIIQNGEEIVAVCIGHTIGAHYNQSFFDEAIKKQTVTDWINSVLFGKDIVLEPIVEYNYDLFLEQANRFHDTEENTQENTGEEQSGFSFEQAIDGIMAQIENNSEENGIENITSGIQESFDSTIGEQINSFTDYDENGFDGYNDIQEALSTQDENFVDGLIRSVEDAFGMLKKLVEEIVSVAGVSLETG